MIAVGFLIGLGFRIIAFAWVTNPLKDLLAAVVLATVRRTAFLLSVFDPRRRQPALRNLLPGVHAQYLRVLALETRVLGI